MRSGVLLVAGVACLACGEVVGLGPERAKLGADGGPWDGAVRQPDPSSGLLLVANAEGTEPACRDELPSLSIRPGAGQFANCNSNDAPLAGKESIRFGKDEWVGCDRCWPDPESDLWFLALARLHGNYFFGLALAQFYAGTDPDTKSPTGPLLNWAGPELWIGCSPADPDGGKALDFTLSVEPGQAYAVALHFDAASGLAELWAEPYSGSGAPSVPDRPPDGTLDCRPDAAVQGWIAVTSAKYYEPGGFAYLDHVVIARSRAALANASWD
jgi:hypothetical protein